MGPSHRDLCKRREPRSVEETELERRSAVSRANEAERQLKVLRNRIADLEQSQRETSNEIRSLQGRVFSAEAEAAKIREANKALQRRTNRRVLPRRERTPVPERTEAIAISRPLLDQYSKIVEAPEAWILPSAVRVFCYVKDGKARIQIILFLRAPGLDYAKRALAPFNFVRSFRGKPSLRLLGKRQAIAFLEAYSLDFPELYHFLTTENPSEELARATSDAFDQRLQTGFPTPVDSTALERFKKATQ